MKEIKYVGFYDTPDNAEEKRNYVPSCATKMEYVMSAIHSCGYAVRVISASATRTKKSYNGKTINLRDGITLKLFKTYPFGNKLQRIFSVLSMKWQLFLELLLHTKSTDIILVYHSLFYMSVVTLAHKIRNFRLVIEAEEIYADVIQNEKIKRREVAFLKQADAYIFPTVLLNNVINTQNKPFAICHGTYCAEADRGERFDDGRIHCVYAGTFDPRKGAFTAVDAAAFLSERYHMHILGFGSDKDRQALLDRIEETAKETKCTITFDGLKVGEEYIRFIQKCHIGLSTQTPEAAYNATSFPSKVLTYIANGLRVVSVRIEALETSEVNDLLYYYETPSPECVADVIKSVDITDEYGGRDRLKHLDRSFCENVMRVLGG